MQTDLGLLDVQSIVSQLNNVLKIPDHMLPVCKAYSS